MAHTGESNEERAGAALGDLLAGYRMFMENIYSLMRFLEAEVTRSGWDLVKNGGYAVTRNGCGLGLASFATANWVTTAIGIAFVRAGLASFVQGTTNTAIPPEGLDLLIFQVRWLDKSPAEPAVWYARLHVEPDGSEPPKKWEEYQSQVFVRLEPQTRPSGALGGEIHPGRVTVSGKPALFSGRYVEVPVADLQTQDDVVTGLLQPALAGEGLE